MSTEVQKRESEQELNDTAKRAKTKAENNITTETASQTLEQCSAKTQMWVHRKSMQNFYKLDSVFVFCPKLKLHPLPFYVDSQGVLDEIGHFLKSRSESTELLLIEDGRGMGKTAALIAATERAGFYHYILQPNAGIMKIIAQAVKLELQEKYPDGCKEEALINGMETLFVEKLLTLMNKLLIHIFEQGYVVPFVPEFQQQSTPELLSNTHATLIKNLSLLECKLGIVIHLDNIEEWAIDCNFIGDKKRVVQPENFAKYFLIGYCNAIQMLQIPKTHFALTGCTVRQSSVIYRCCKLKCKTFQLPYFSTGVVELLFSLFCDTRHLNKDILCNRVLSRLEGCPKNFEYFISNVYNVFNGTVAEAVTTESLMQCVDHAFNSWKLDTEILCSSLEWDFADKLLLPFILPQTIGAKRETLFPLKAINVSAQLTSNNWVKYVEAGLIRMQTNGFYTRIWVPHGFLANLIISLSTKFEIGATLSEITSSAIFHVDSSLQHAVALELIQSESPLLNYLVDTLKAKLDITFQPIKSFSNKVHILPVDYNPPLVRGLCSYIDVNSNAGYISGINLLDNKQKVWRVFIKIALGVSSPMDQIKRFFENSNGKENELFIFCVMHQQIPTVQQIEKKESKILVVIDGMNKEHTKLDLNELINPGTYNLELEDQQSYVDVSDFELT